jgi:hypothetical protein
LLPRCDCCKLRQRCKTWRCRELNNKIKVHWRSRGRLYWWEWLSWF